MPTPHQSRALQGLDGIAHGFFTREGGVSEGLYQSLNCGLGSRDDRDAVMENRERVAAALTGRRGPVQTLYQIHSARALVIDGPIPLDRLPQADAVVTRTPGLVIGTLTADCTPVLFADEEARVIAAAHAGWRGAVSGVLAATVEAMESIGARRARIRACVGPCIGPESYEVGWEFQQSVLAQHPDSVEFFRTPRPGAKPHFDLPGFAAAALRDAGLGEVEMAAACTYEGAGAPEPRYFSYRMSQHRGQPDYGRQVSAIVLT